MAAVVLIVGGGRVQSEVQRRGREQGESERGRADRDDAGAFTHASRGSAASRSRRGTSHARALSRLCLLAEVRDDWHQARWARPAQMRPRWHHVCFLLSLSLLFSFYFLFFCNCFDLIKMLRHFQKP